MINPLPLVWAMARRHAVISIAFIILIALAVGMGGSLTAQERALKNSSARASDKFDIIVAAPASQIDLLLRVVFLQPASVVLLQGDAERQLLSEKRADFVAPIGFGDNYEGSPVIGTIPQFVMHLSSDHLAEGRNFNTEFEAVIGSASPLHVGDTFHVTHGLTEVPEGAEVHPQTITVVGRMAPTGTPWDRSLLTPIELTWDIHGLGTGHGDAKDFQIGPPFDLATVPGIPAAVIKPTTLAAAYGLRSQYRNETTMAFFPAEVLDQLYSIIGDVRAIMSALSIATEVLLVAAVLAGILMMMRLYRQRFAVLRALGASRTYIFAVAWTYSFSLIAIGSLLGLAVAAAWSGSCRASLARRAASPRRPASAAHGNRVGPGPCRDRGHPVASARCPPLPASGGGSAARDVSCR